MGRSCLSHVLDRGSYLSPAALLTILAACEGNRPSEGTAVPPRWVGDGESAQVVKTDRGWCESPSLHLAGSRLCVWQNTLYTSCWHGSRAARPARASSREVRVMAPGAQQLKAPAAACWAEL